MVSTIPRTFGVLYGLLLGSPLGPVLFDDVLKCLNGYTLFLPKIEVRFDGEKNRFLVEYCLCHGNPAFNSALRPASFFIVLHKLEILHNFQVC